MRSARDRRRRRSEPPSETLQLQATFTGSYRFGEETTVRWENCPAAVRVTDCILFTTEALVPGLGRATATYTKTFGNGCDGETPVRQFSRAVISVAGKGEIRFALAEPEPLCRPTAPFRTAFRLTITSGSGIYAGASGSAQFESSTQAPDSRGNSGGTSDTWTATLSVPGLDFDVTPPVLSGAVAKTLRAKKGKKRVRVRYAVTAQDAADGSVPVACRPRSGSFFKLGRTVVRCSATDSSANVATVRFSVTVKRTARRAAAMSQVRPVHDRRMRPE